MVKLLFLDAKEQTKFLFQTYHRNLIESSTTIAGARLGNVKQAIYEYCSLSTTVFWFS